MFHYHIDIIITNRTRSARKNIYKKNKKQYYAQLGEKVAHGPRKKPLDFGDNLAHVTSGLGYGKVMVTMGRAMFHDIRMFYPAFAQR